jgi:hypothetical protein
MAATLRQLLPDTWRSSLLGPQRPRRLVALAWLVGTAALVCACGTGAVALAAATAGSRLQVIASALNQPKKLTFGPDGGLIVALSGDGRSPTTCTDAEQHSCLDRSGAIDEVSPSGRVSRLLSGLSSVSSGADDPQATGPIEASLVNGKLRVLFQDLDLNDKTGVTLFGRGSRLGDLVAYSLGRGGSHVEAQLGPYEAKHRPDRGVGTAVKYGYEAAVNSDPYSFVPYKGGYAVADAGANDVLFVSASGKVKVLAVLPTIPERAAAGSFGSIQKKAIEAEAQAVPTAVAVGPDGALYVGELGGLPSDPGTSDIYRLMRGRRPSVFARGFTAIADLTFDAHGRLLVLEFDKKGLSDPGLNDDKPASGELIRVARAGVKTVELSTGLDLPSGLIAQDGYVYISEYGTTPARPGHGGEIVRLKLS